MPAPYKRGYHHTKGRGHESSIKCSFCGRSVPRWKTFITHRGFRVTDPVLKKQLDMRHVSTFSTKMHACPSCARFRGIIKIKR